jgi:hypothetical protein
MPIRCSGWTDLDADEQPAIFRVFRQLPASKRLILDAFVLRHEWYSNLSQSEWHKMAKKTALLFDGAGLCGLPGWFLL